MVALARDVESTTTAGHSGLRLCRDAAEQQPRAEERRLFLRAAQRDVVVEAMRLDHSPAARQSPRLSLVVHDFSQSGACATADRPLHAGEELGFLMPSRDGFRGFRAFGRVVRCDPAGQGYRVAVEFDTLPAA